MSKKIEEHLINLNLLKLIEVNLSIEQFVFLTLLDENKPEIYLNYTKQFKSIISSKDQLHDLINRNLVVQFKKDNYDFNNFKVTNYFHELFNVNKSQLILDLKNTYPKQTPSGKRKGLQADQVKWIPKYLNIVKNNLDLHNLIINCIKYEVADKEANGQLEFMPLLTTYLNNKRWEVYEEEVKNMMLKGESIEEINNNSIEDI